MQILKIELRGSRPVFELRDEPAPGNGTDMDPMLEDGIILDFQRFEETMAHRFPSKKSLLGNLGLEKKTAVIGIPLHMSPAGKYIVFTATDHIGMKETSLIYSPMAYVYGDGILREKSVDIIDVGRYKTCMCRIKNGVIEAEKVLPVGAFHFAELMPDPAPYAAYLRNQMDTFFPRAGEIRLIGEKTDPALFESEAHFAVFDPAYLDKIFKGFDEALKQSVKTKTNRL